MIVLTIIFNQFIASLLNKSINPHPPPPPKDTHPYTFDQMSLLASVNEWINSFN